MKTKTIEKLTIERDILLKAIEEALPILAYASPGTYSNCEANQMASTELLKALKDIKVGE